MYYMSKKPVLPQKPKNGLFHHVMAGANLTLCKFNNKVETFFFPLEKKERCLVFAKGFVFFLKVSGTLEEERCSFCHGGQWRAPKSLWETKQG